MTRRLVMIRHGQTHYNATRRMQGQLDTELSDLGREQARAAGEMLVDAGISRILSSDLARAYDTACIIAGILGVEVEKDARLRETHLGQWQAKSHDEIDVELPGARAIWRHDATWAPPEGESRVQVAQRARPVIDDLMADYDGWDGQAVLVVAHGGTISALTSNLLGLDVSMYPLLSGLKNGCRSQLTARPRFEPGSFDALDDFQVRANSIAGDGAAGESGAAKKIRTPEFTPETVGDAQWYLDGWNMG